jgi:putative peptidoglycan lipid II flippase
VLFWTTAGSDVWLHAGTWERIQHLAIIVPAGAGSYFAALWVTGFRLADFSKREAGDET